jgi:Tol biopolymer transport system component
MSSQVSPRRFGAALVTLLALGGGLAIESASASFPGDNGRIVYQRYYRGGSEIFSIRPSTGRSQRLTSPEIQSGNAISAGDPAYSPNGRRVVFLNAADVGPGARRNNVFLMRFDGGHPRQLTHSTTHLSAPAFTADGSEIAYGKGGDTFVMGLHGENRRNLTAALPGGGVGADFSADGTKVAVTTFDGGDADIVVMNVDGTAPVNVTAASSDDEYSPDFSPDGTQIAFVTNRADSDGDVWVMDDDGATPHPVAATSVEDQDPAFSPDGTKIAYTSRRSASAGVGVFVMPSSGGPRTKLPHTGTSQNPDWAARP